MNVLLLNWRDPMNPQAGGAEMVTFEHAKAWVKAGHDVSWLTTRFPHAKSTESLDGVRIIRKGNSMTQFFWAPYFYFRSGKRYDLVVDQIHGLPYFTPLYVRKPIVAFIHEVAGEIWNSMFPFPVNWIGHRLEKISFSFYKNIPFITVSESTRQELKKNGIRNIKIIQNGMTQITVQPEKKEKHPTFLFISRLVKMKGVEDVLKAFSLIREVSPTAQLWIIGDGDQLYVSTLQDMVRRLGMREAVTFFGKVREKEKFSFMRRAHILLHASQKEGWGMVVIEAATQETPAVVYDVPGLRDSVVHNKTGIITSENTPEALAKAAYALVTDTKRLQEFGRNGRHRAAGFAWEDGTQESLAYIESL